MIWRALSECWREMDPESLMVAAKMCFKCVEFLSANVSTSESEVAELPACTAVALSSSSFGLTLFRLGGVVPVVVVLWGEYPPPDLLLVEDSSSSNSCSSMPTDSWLSGDKFSSGIFFFLVTCHQSKFNHWQIEQRGGHISVAVTTNKLLLHVSGDLFARLCGV